MTLPTQPREMVLTAVVRAVILGAGPPARGQRPAALHSLGVNGRVLDWLVGALRTACDDVLFVGGYGLQEIVGNYPTLRVVLNPTWATTGPVGSLLRAGSGQQAGACLVSYADILYRDTLVRELQAHPADTVIAIDTRWRERYEGRSAADIASAEVVALDGERVAGARGRFMPGRAVQPDAEYVGLAKLGPASLARLAARASDPDLARWDMPRLFEALLADGVPIAVVDCGGDWAELNAAQDIAHFVLGTKAQTLERLRPMVTWSHIGEQVSFTVGEWHEQSSLCLHRLLEAFPSGMVVVRSSALDEDGFRASSAGRYESVLSVPGGDEAALRSAVEKVISSYGDPHPAHQILVQRMLTDVALSGVVMTRTLAHGAPYRVVNYDATSGATDSVTSGRGRDLRTLYLHRDASDLPPGCPPGLDRLVPAVRELEQLVGHDCLDVEFIVSSDDTVHVLQIRPIAVDRGHWRGSDELVRTAIDEALEAFRRLQAPGVGVLGTRTIFSVMSDWNPAEMIGTRPDRLAYSLYAELVTREVWATQRAEYGYRDLRPTPLMHSFAGHPYIDVRASFNSFVPAALDDSLAARLVEHYLDLLSAKPALHDKVEFEIVLNCLDLGFEARTRELADAGFQTAEIGRLRDALWQLTVDAIQRVDGDLQAVERLAVRQQLMCNDRTPALRRALALIDDCRRHGTLPFAHLARSAFVATAWLRSAVAVGVISEDERVAYLQSVDTVASAFRDASAQLRAGRLSLPAFLERYGHLRPGTYDVTVQSYAEAPERYLLAAGVEPEAPGTPTETTLSWSAGTRRRFADALASLGLPDDFNTLDRFMRTAIAGREHAKHVFTRSLSRALDLFAEFANEAGLSRAQLAQLTVADLRACAEGLWDGRVSEHLRRRCEEGELAVELALGIELPPLILSAHDFSGFLSPQSAGNFIGRLAVTAPVIRIDTCGDSVYDLRGRIVVIMQADPGHDWLFAQGIAGLVTAYGGANSHMAVRAAEFGLPAAVGVGEEWFKRLATGTRLMLDCRQRTLVELP
jgi:choline kinase/phosphohistidine swiveling domain-containing protein